MAAVLLGIHVLICFTLMVIVLLQSGKGGGLAGAFGGAGGVGAVFGGQAAATFLTKATRYLAAAYMISALSMALVVKVRTEGTVASEVQNLEAVPAASATGAAIPSEGAPGEIPEGLPGADQGEPSGETPPPAGDEGQGE
jgi:preprotein translocase subunit SecG